MKTLTQYRKELIRRFGKTEARTAKGLLRFWRSQKRPSSVLKLDESDVYNRSGSSFNLRKQEYKTAEAMRKANPDRKRAANDPVFRRNWVKRLQREAKHLTRPFAGALDYSARLSDAPRIAAVGSLLGDLKAKTVAHQPPKVTRLSLTLATAQEKAVRQEIGGEALDRAQWSFCPSTRTRVVAHQNHETIWKNGRPRTGASSDHRIGYQSFALPCDDGKRLSIARLGTEHNLAMPDGYTVAVDDLGVKLVRDSDSADYHPSTYGKELHQHDPAEWVRELLALDDAREAQKQRQANQERNLALFAADLKTTRVHMCDSRRAGNCAAGTVTFGERLGIRREEYNGLNSPGVSAALLVRTGDHRAKAAAFAAWERETLVSI
jgi:hypothetical protein